jgi:hypothetical protein
MTCQCGDTAVVRYKRHGDLCETGYCSACVNGLRDVPAIRYSVEYGGDDES